MEDEEKPASGVSEAGIDFSGVKALANTEFKREPRHKAIWNSFVEGLLQLGLFLLGLVLDIVKAIWAVISGLFVNVYKLIVGLGHFFRKWFRIFKETDGYGKASFLIQGLANIHYGQVVDGVVFMAVEVLFIGFMLLFGGTNIANLIQLEGGHRASHTRLILGIATILIIIAYVVVYIKGIQSTYDGYQIVHNFEFRQAREDQLYVLRNLEKFQDIDFFHDSAHSIKKKMRHEYGYSKLSARYISYVPFKMIPDRIPNPIAKWWRSLGDGLFVNYSVWRDRIRAGKWSNCFAKFLDYKRKPLPERYGVDTITSQIQSGLTKFHHTYDKYNNYLATVRDSSTEIEVLKDPGGIIAACYAEDSTSKENGIVPIDRKTKLKVNDVVSRIVGYFDTELVIARRISKMAVKAIEEEARGGEKAVAALKVIHDQEEKGLENFIARFSTRKVAEIHSVENVYLEYRKYRPLFDRGEKAFVQGLISTEHIEKRDAVMLFRDYSLSIKDNYDDETKTKETLATRGAHFHDIVTLYDTYPFHGEPIRFKKQIKQYADEKFAVSVLGLPVLGALLTVIIPLIFSIAVAFTAWDYDHTAYNFGWSLSGFNQVFNLSEGSSFSAAFLTLLYWTLIWAFFATFTNYIFGIILALLINKKGIRLKKMWRTFFVITIAIPQFITLLLINLLLSDGGAVNKWFESMGWGHFPFLGNVNNSMVDISTADYIIPKITIIIINMWVGIPYTMLSTSGILMNIPEDLYESARIDGASPWTQFWKITMPYILFVTGPSLLTTFIGNINNFNVIYFLTGGGPTVQDDIGLANAGHTDLLITWLFKLTTADSPQYNIASVIGIAVFVICAFFSLIMYKRMGSVKNEEEFQ